MVFILDQDLGLSADSGERGIFGLPLFSNPLCMAQEWDQPISTLHHDGDGVGARVLKGFGIVKVHPLRSHPQLL